MTSSPAPIPALRHTTVDGLRVAYRESGSGPAVLLLHGWPTSSYLWRGVIPWLARTHRVIAVDLPGYGDSAKPLDVDYGFGFYAGVLDGFLANLDVDRVAIVCHDLGGPVGVHWALRRPERVTALAVLNTLLHPELPAVAEDLFRSLRTPGEWERIVGPTGLAAMMRLGVATGTRLARTVIDAVTAPFADDDARAALARAGTGLGVEEFGLVAAGLPTITAPVRVIFGRQDPLMPDVDATVARLRTEIRHAQVTVLDDCSHFLQEDAPDRVGQLLAEFLDRVPLRAAG